MARRLVWMPVLPRVTVSDALNLRGRGLRARACTPWGNAAECSQAAPAVEAERRRNSRRFMGPPRETSFQRMVHLLWTDSCGPRLSNPGRFYGTAEASSGRAREEH